MVGLTNPQSTSGFSFGQSNQPSLGGFSSGQSNPPPSSGFSLPQANPTPNTGFAIGAVNPSNSSFSLGQPTSQVSSTGFTLGQAAPQASSSGFSLGQTNPPTSSGFSFGTPATTSSGISFGTSGSFGSSNASPFGITSGGATTSGLNFGQPSTSTSQFGLSVQSGATTSSGGFSFGTAVTSSLATSSSSGFSFGSSGTAASVPSLNHGQSSLSAAQGLGGTAPSSTLPSTTSVGLGGFQPTSIASGVGSAIKADGKSAKETPLPNEIFSTLSAFENYKDTEKKASEDNIRQTAAPFHKLCEDTKKLKQHILKLSNQHAQLHANGKKLKWTVLQDSENVEMARRTHDTPMTLQGNNKAPECFFLQLVRSFEERMSNCKNKIDEIERCSVANGNSLDVTPEDMTAILHKEHETVKMQAAQIYNLHNKLLDLYKQINNPVQPIPEALFKSALNQNEKSEITLKNSSVLRPCLGDSGSGLLNFQNGQQKAKAALSLAGGTAPPALSLMQSSLLGGFGTPTSSNKLFEANKPLGLAASLAPIGASTFNQPSQQFNMFPSSNTSIFGSKPFGKVPAESDESQRKRRI